MTGFSKFLFGSALALASMQPAIGFAAMPERPVATQGDVLQARVVCDFNGCWETHRPPPGFRPPPPPPGYYRPPPPPPGGYYRPPPPPPGGYYRPPPPPDFRDGPRLSRRHINWCLDRYRSYDPRSNTYVSRDGYERQCRSPFF